MLFFLPPLARSSVAHHGAPSDDMNSTHRPPEPHPNWIQEEFKKGSGGVPAESGHHSTLM